MTQSNEKATNQPNVGRRKFLKVGVGVAVAAAAAAAGGYYYLSQAPSTTPATNSTMTSASATMPSTSQQQINLTLVGWVYMTDVVNSNLKRFSQQNPGVNVNLYLPPAYAGYYDKVLTMISGGEQIDALYVRGEYLGSWYEFLEPLDNYPGMQDLVSDMFPSAVQGLKYKGSIYGTPYYLGYEVFPYDEAKVKAAGFDGPPTTWDEFITQSVQIKKMGICKYPALMYGSPQIDNLDWSFYNQLASRGTTLFDQNFNATSGALDALQFLQDCYQKYQIIDPGTLEMTMDDALTAFMSGKYAFWLNVDCYYATPANIMNPQTSAIAATAKSGLMPGTGGSFQWVRLYSMPKASNYKDTAWKLLNFLGGKGDITDTYYVAKQWLLQGGLPQPQISLYDDPDVIKAISAYMDVNVMKQQISNSTPLSAIVPYETDWYNEFDDYLCKQVQLCLLGQLKPEDCMNSLASQAQQLAAQG